MEAPTATTVVDPRLIDDALGGEAGYTRMTPALRAAGLGQLLDIVPNHMATHPDNPWWWDVLANGASSRYASYFDIGQSAASTRRDQTRVAHLWQDHSGCSNPS